MTLLPTHQSSVHKLSLFQTSQVSAQQGSLLRKRKCKPISLHHNTPQSHRQQHSFLWLHLYWSTWCTHPPAYNKGGNSMHSIVRVYICVCVWMHAHARTCTSMSKCVDQTKQLHTDS